MEANAIKKSFIWDYMDKITTQGLSLIISIVLARLIEPEQYGIIAMATIFTQILDVFVNPGFTSALIQKKSPERLDYSTVFWSNTVISVVLYLIIFFASAYIEDFYKIENLSFVIRILALNLPFSGVNSIVIAYIRKNVMYKRYFFISFFGTFVSGGVAIAMAYSGFGIWSLVMYYLGNCVLDALFSLIFISWKPTLEFSKQRFKSLYAFGGKLLYVKLIDVTYKEISGLIIGKKYTASDLAYYKKGDAYPKTIIQNLSMSISGVLFPLFSNIQDKIEELTISLKKALRMCDFIIYPMAIGLLACGDNFVEVLLTDKWAMCVPYLRIMCLYNLFTPSSSIIYQVIKALGKGGLLLRLEFFKKSYSILLIILAMLIVESPIVIAVAIALSGAISLAVNLTVVSKYTSFKLTDYAKGVFPILVISLIMAVVVLAVNCFKFNALITLITQVLIGGTVYIGLAWLFKFKQLSDIFSEVKTKVKKEHKN